MRITPVFLCFSLIFSSALAADPAAPSAVGTYISARDRAAAAVKADPSRETKALADLDRLIKLAVPPWSPPDAPVKGKINLSTLSEDDEDYGALDGVSYAVGDTTVIATVTPLVSRWLADHKTWWEDQKNVPATMAAAFRSEAFWTQALPADAAAYLHGLVLVSLPKGTDLAIVELSAFAQDNVYDRGPDRLLAAVVKGERVLLAWRPLQTKLAPVPFCKKALDLTLNNAKAEKDPAKSNAQMEKADREYRACFAVRLREQAAYADLQKEAQTLADLLK